MKDPKNFARIQAATASANAESSEVPSVVRLPKFATRIRVITTDLAPAAGFKVTPSQIARTRTKGFRTRQFC